MKDEWTPVSSGSGLPASTSEQPVSVSCRDSPTKHPNGEKTYDQQSRHLGRDVLCLCE